MSPSSNEHESGDVDLQDILRNVEELKAEGNDHFRAQRWSEALVAYQSGLGDIPKRKPKLKVTPSFPDNDGDNDKESESNEEDTQPLPIATAPLAPLSEEEEVYPRMRSVLNANIAACYLKLSEYKHVVEACTEAIHDDPKYIKAFQRRAIASEKLDTWTSLSQAQEDYTKLLNILPEDAPDRKDIPRKLKLLQPKVEAAQKKETGEMLDKLKGLGNSVLGNFGLSTNNFQFVPNGQGGYSMNFQK